MRQINYIVVQKTSEENQSLKTPQYTHFLNAKSLQSCPTLCDPIGYSLHSLWTSPGKNTGVGCPAFLQSIFPNQGCLFSLLHWQADFFHHQCHLNNSFVSSHFQQWSLFFSSWKIIFKTCPPNAILLIITTHLLKLKNFKILAVSKVSIWHIKKKIIISHC